MTRFAFALVVTALVFVSAAVVARADISESYTNPGVWFSPGVGAGSRYDNCAGRWVENNFSKGSASWGLITFIDPGGGWHDTRYGYGWLVKQTSILNSTKKLHCKNNSSARYQGGCYGFIRQYNCV